ncbi:MAG: UDP-N-acetylmuramoyl-tripeptide--D-alanyl-D-alanine ligase [Actinomycetota bacterium]|nr:UDP-N-acetylmuramoyl-tripeptide--D-alanyl-D-alanine ligase [Actinomycetota bacterium]
MFPLTVSQILLATNGELLNGLPQRVINDISIDTRTLKPGDLFIPIKGDHYDGHQFLKCALEKGAFGFLTQKWDKALKNIFGELKEETIVIRVEDGLKALKDLAQYLRGQLRVEVVGITGSTGKTCTKDMLANVLSQRMKVIWSERNYNNEIGVPLTILKAEQGTQILVVEMAMRGLGQIRELAEIAHPTIGLVTNVGKTHFEFLGSEELIAQAKSELVEAIPEDGIVFLNQDDFWTERLKSLSLAQVLTFGLSELSNFRACDINVDSMGKPSFKILSNRGDIWVNLPILGRHNVYNALATFAIASYLGLPLEDIKNGLETCTLSGMRMQLLTTPKGITILNDAYNANPTSMRAALIALGDIKSQSRKIAVLGDMLELGEITDVSHFELGKFVKEVGVNTLITVGERSKRIAEGALQSGMDSKEVISCDASTEAARILNRMLEQGDIVLIKASRAMKLEEVADSLL